MFRCTRILILPLACKTVISGVPLPSEPLARRDPRAHGGMRPPKDSPPGRFVSAIYILCQRAPTPGTFQFDYDSVFQGTWPARAVWKPQMASAAIVRRARVASGKYQAELLSVTGIFRVMSAVYRAAASATNPKRNAPAASAV